MGNNVLQERIAITNSLAMLPGFYQVNVAAEQTDVQLLVAGGAANAGIVMPQSGWIVGLTGSLSAAATAGSLTVGVTVDGTEKATTTQTVTTGQEINAQFDTATTRRFARGEQIGVEITTGATWDGTTADLDVQVWVVFDNWEY